MENQNTEYAVLHLMSQLMVPLTSFGETVYHEELIIAMDVVTKFKSKADATFDAGYISVGQHNQFTDDVNEAIKRVDAAVLSFIGSDGGGV